MAGPTPIPAPTSYSLARDTSETYFRSLHLKSFQETSRASSSAIVRRVSWNALGSLIAASGTTTPNGVHVIRIWNPDKPDVKYSTELRGHTQAADSIAWDPTLADRLVSCSAGDGTVRLWDVRLRETLKILKLTANAAGASGAGNAGNQTASSLKDGAAVEGATNLPQLCPLLVRFTPDGRWVLISGTQGRGIYIVDAKTFAPSENGSNGVLEVSNDSDVTCATVSNSCSVLAVGLSSGAVKFYSFDTQTGHADPEPVWTMNAHRTGITCMEFDQRGQFLALGSNDSLVSIWDTQELACIRTIGKSAFPVKSISFSFDGAYLAVSLEAADPVQIIHVESGEIVHSIGRTSAFSVPSLDWHPLRYWLAFGGDPTGLKILGNLEKYGGSRGGR
ncbi:WD40-repeat-containing domain protein [Myxozyma melibiosi]|uniref:WD40-repeat-containing domain protein n=1 Tax=Myxozyma melibiosi TaxID=54550 RepID=A0ABR1FEU3_9ASCO